MLDTSRVFFGENRGELVPRRYRRSLRAVERGEQLRRKEPSGHLRPPSGLFCYVPGNGPDFSRPSIGPAKRKRSGLQVLPPHRIRTRLLWLSKRVEVPRTQHPEEHKILKRLSFGISPLEIVFFWKQEFLLRGRSCKRSRHQLRTAPCGVCAGKARNSSTDISRCAASSPLLFFLPFLHLKETQINTTLLEACYYQPLQLLLTTLPNFVEAFRNSNRECDKFAKATIRSHSGHNKIKQKGRGWSGLLEEIRKGRHRFDNGPRMNTKVKKDDLQCE